MPFKSKKQVSYMFWKHPEIAKRWTKNYRQDLKKLPEKAAETIRVNAFFDELDKIAKKKSEWRKDLPWTGARAATGVGAALAYGYLLGNTLEKMKKSVKKVETKYPKQKGFKPKFKRGVKVFGAKSKHLIPYAILTGGLVSAGKGFSESRIKRRLEKKYN